MVGVPDTSVCATALSTTTRQRCAACALAAACREGPSTLHTCAHHVTSALIDARNVSTLCCAF